MRAGARGRGEGGVRARGRGGTVSGKGEAGCRSVDGVLGAGLGGLVGVVRGLVRLVD